MKKWNNPSLEELSLSATAYHPDGGSKYDGTYQSNDGQYTDHTYGPSSGNAGKPYLKGNNPPDYPAIGKGAGSNSSIAGVR